METQNQSRDYARIEKAILYIEAHYRDQPTLDRIAAETGLSPHHFQRLFTRWAGISPKQFVRYLTVEYAKAALDRTEPVLDAALDSGLSGPSRLHDLFVDYEAVSPGEYKTMGVGLKFHYGFHDGPFGAFLLAATDRGICSLTFVDDTPEERDQRLQDIRSHWPGGEFIHDPDFTGRLAELAFAPRTNGPGEPLRVWLKGTNFQIKVWQALLLVPSGRLSSYGEIGRAMGKPRAARAIGSALADNPVAWLIPCHRVIRATGGFKTDYRWGSARKRAMIGWEAARREAHAM
ncbi:MAG: methylated-DNA--[protein]-cysteine S-methyltransferase [Pseudomonadota bacterium]|nr:methylated-DNA--[protein]-cysteine S-methyltransferase [Pseudomonadota bacterium]